MRTMGRVICIGLAFALLGMGGWAQAKASKSDKSSSKEQRSSDVQRKDSSSQSDRRDEAKVVRLVPRPDTADVKLRDRDVDLKRSEDRPKPAKRKEIVRDEPLREPRHAEITIIDNARPAKERKVPVIAPRIEDREPVIVSTPARRNTIQRVPELLPDTPAKMPVVRPASELRRERLKAVVLAPRVQQIPTPVSVVRDVQKVETVRVEPAKTVRHLPDAPRVDNSRTESAKVVRPVPRVPRVEHIRAQPVNVARRDRDERRHHDDRDVVKRDGDRHHDWDWNWRFSYYVPFYWTHFRTYYAPDYGYDRCRMYYGGYCGIGYGHGYAPWYLPYGYMPYGIGYCARPWGTYWTPSWYYGYRCGFYQPLFRTCGCWLYAPCIHRHQTRGGDWCRLPSLYWLYPGRMTFALSLNIDG